MITDFVNYFSSKTLAMGRGDDSESDDKIAVVYVCLFALFDASVYASAFPAIVAEPDITTGRCGRWLANHQTTSHICILAQTESLLHNTLI
jgi:hypothetical protein